MYDEIARRHRPPVLRYLARELYGEDAALDVGQTTFHDVFTALKSHKWPQNPSKLGAWVMVFAKNRLQNYRKQRSALLRREALVEPEDVTEVKSAPQMFGDDPGRLENVRLILYRAVLPMLDPDEQRLLALLSAEQISDAQALERLGLSKNRATTARKKVSKLFYAYLLTQDPPDCPQLALILDDYAGEGFAALLASRVIKHFDDCPVCQNCRTCHVQRKHHAREYAPVFIPLVCAAEFSHRVRETMTEVVYGRPRGASPSERLWPPPVTLYAAPGLPPAPAPWPNPGTSLNSAGSRGGNVPSRGLAAVLGLAILAILAVTVPRVIPAGPPTSATPVSLTSSDDVENCQLRVLVYAACFGPRVLANDGSNPLVKQLLAAPQGGITRVDRNLSVQFVASEPLIHQPAGNEPTPLPPNCFTSGSNRQSWALAADGAVQTVFSGSTLAEDGIIPLDAPTAADLAADLGTPLRSCFSSNLFGDNYVLDERPAPIAGMRSFAIRNVGPVPRFYTGHAVSMQYSTVWLQGNNYLYATSLSESTCDAIARALHDKAASS
ncbi:RNA polymerase sigma factor [Streptomyces sp. NPDC127038]|uniref:RNA polymerase sigma factor n=1 Tax=Streptomyces sp. NPDC127038 TaxID=3347114 RepID=UPI00364FCB51